MKLILKFIFFKFIFFTFTEQLLDAILASYIVLPELEEDHVEVKGINSKRSSVGRHARSRHYARVFFFPSKRITAIPKEGAVQVGIHISTISMQPLAIPQEGAVQVGIHISTISMQPQATP